MYCHGSITVKVSTDLTYESDHDDAEETECELENMDILKIESKAQYDINKQASSLATIPLKLLIIAKTKFNAGFCYLGFSQEDQCLIRPIYNTKTGNCCWGREH